MSLQELDGAIDRAGGASAVLAKIETGLQRRRTRPLPAEEPPAVLRRLDYVVASELPEITEAFDDELVEGVIGRAAMAVIYGDSNSGKTFFAVELAACVSLMAQFLGRNTAGGLVLYLATEAAGSVKLRFQARRRRHGTAPPGVVIVQSPINLFDGQADVTAVLALVDEIESLVGEKVVLIIGDTLARISAGANENSGEDMGVVMKHADAIRGATGATFVWIHHSGKDVAKGMRGWSGMRAAVDTEIEITEDSDTGVRTAEITKQRDLPGKGDKLIFRLQPVELGVNAWGSPRGSCVVQPAEAPGTHVSGVVARLDDQQAEQTVLAGFQALQAMGIKPVDGPTSPDYLPRLMVDKGLAGSYRKHDLKRAMDRLMTAGTLARGVIGHYSNRTPKQGLVITNKATN